MTLLPDVQALADLRRAVRGGIVLRRQPGDGLEHAVEIAGAAADRLGQFVQAMALPRSARSGGKPVRSSLHSRLDRRSVRVAALAGRKAGRLAPASVLCSWTFSGLAVRDGQEGRQYTPVVATEYQKHPSAVLSRATMRAQRGSSAISGEMLGCWPFERRGHGGSLPRWCCRRIMSPHSARTPPVLAFKSNWATSAGNTGSFPHTAIVSRL